MHIVQYYFFSLLCVCILLYRYTYVQCTCTGIHKVSIVNFEVNKIAISKKFRTIYMIFLTSIVSTHTEFMLKLSILSSNLNTDALHRYQEITCFPSEFVRLENLSNNNVIHIMRINLHGIVCDFGALSMQSECSRSLDEIFSFTLFFWNFN